RNVLAKSLGTTNPINMAKATVAALQDLRRPEDVAKIRGKRISEVLPLPAVTVEAEAPVEEAALAAAVVQEEPMVVEEPPAPVEEAPVVEETPVSEEAPAEETAPETAEPVADSPAEAPADKPKRRTLRRKKDDS
ncbi:MAG TPA: hypothetical protein VFL58_10680, partial [Gaiellaceae bacterium]|nr:hypothetical protein [Gaiellaceae bacterium]